MELHHQSRTMMVQVIVAQFLGSSPPAAVESRCIMKPFQRGISPGRRPLPTTGGPLSEVGRFAPFATLPGGSSRNERGEPLAASKDGREAGLEFPDSRPS